MGTDDGAAPPAGEHATLAALVRGWRERALLTQEELALRTGLGARTIRRLESGELGRPRSASLRLVADALELSPAEQALLTAAARDLPAPPARAAMPVPSQLPADVAGFTGRARHLERLDAALARTGTAGVVIQVIAGPAGVGKTALAVHWGHRVAERFPDGRLYVNLRGHSTGPPVGPVQALALLLGGLGLAPEQIPADLDAAAALYRSLLTGKKAMIVLDGARDAEQVRPLLPGNPGCLVVITSRDRLTGLVATHGAERLALDVLGSTEAVSLLAAVAGRERIGAEPAASADLARLCGHLPLALRIAAANLANQPGLPVAAYVGTLGAGDRLAGLEVDGDPRAAVRIAFDNSYATLDPEARRLFRLLGLAPGPDVDPPAAAALAGIPLQRSARLLERLAGGHLVEPCAPGRYDLHDLLRRYAEQRTRDEDARAERAAATLRLYHWYLRTADAAARLLHPRMFRLDLPPAEAGLPPPEFADYADALAWLDAERANLVAAARHAAGHGPKPMAWLLADALRGYLVLRRHAADWLAVAGAGLSAAAAAGDQRALATAHFSLGLASWSLGTYPAAVEHYTAALGLFTRVGWPDAEAATIANLGLVYTDLGDLRQAADLLSRALVLDRQTGRLERQANALASLGVVDRELGRLDSAAERQAEALALYREVGARSGEAYALNNLGEVDHDLGRLDHARQRLGQALDLYRLGGNRSGEAYALHALAAVHRDAGRYPAALTAARAAVDLAAETRERRIHAEALNTLGSVHLRLGDRDAALEHHQRALDLARAAGTRHAQAAALVGLAETRLRQGRHDEAAAQALPALDLARMSGYQVLQAQAHAILAEVDLARGRREAAIEHARRALALHRATGHRLGHARALVTFGRVMACDQDVAAASWRGALRLFADAGSPEAEDVRALLSSTRQHTGTTWPPAPETPTP